MAKLVIRHDLHLLNEADAKQYLRDVSEFLEIDPDLNAFDLIWMPNPGGEGRTLCVYARRGTCELLRDKHVINVLDQDESIIEGSYRVRVKGQNKKGRTEIALGSRSIDGLKGRDRDDAIMTASTRALQRLTMQFTGLGILSESEVTALANQTVVAPNPSAGATLAGSPMVVPPQPSVGVNNAPGKPVGTTESFPVSQDPATQAQVATVIAMREIDNAKLARAAADVAAKTIGNELATKADIQPDIQKAENSTTPIESTTSVGQETGQLSGNESATKPARKPRTKKNTVNLNGVDPEPERVSAPPATPDAAATPLLCLDCKQPLSEHQLINSARVCADKIEKAKNPLADIPASVPVSSPSVAPSQAPEKLESPLPVTPALPVSAPATPVGDLPTAEQMAGYRTFIATYTKELPPSKDGTYGCTQRMRAFITKWNGGTPPQQMSVKQWDDTVGFFRNFMMNNNIKNLVGYIGDFLGDNR